MAGEVIKYSVLAALLISPICSLAGDLKPAQNRHFEYNFLPINTWEGENSKSKIFAACDIGNIPIGKGSKGDQMCDDDLEGTKHL